jgi:uncharacterized membrane protein YbhN (UPF0104 family)
MIWFLARCGITVGLLALLIWQLGAGLIIERMWTLSLGPLVLVAILLAVQLVLSAWRWKALVNHFACVQVSTADLCRFLGASHFYGEFLPSTIGGDVVRTAMLAQQTGVAPATLSVVLDRITGLAMLLLMIVALLPLIGFRIDQGSALVALAVLGIGGLLAIGVLLTLRYKFILGWLPGPAAIVPQISECLQEALFSRTLRPQIVGCGLLVQLLSVMLFFLLSRAIGVPLPFLDCLLVVPPALLISALPLSLSGWGVREGALAGGFALVGGAVPADIVAVSILYGLTSPAIGAVYAVLSLLRH